MQLQINNAVSQCASHDHQWFYSFEKLTEQNICEMLGGISDIQESFCVYTQPMREGITL